MTFNSLDEPVSPAGRVLVTPEMNQVILCGMGLERPPNADLAKNHIVGTLLQHPRFRSLMTRDASGREHWRLTDVDVDRHIITVDHPVSETGNDDLAVNEYLADLSTGPGLSFDKPLWEIHILTVHRCIIFRIHHAVGDGISLMSLLLLTCRKVGDPTATPEIPPVRSYKNKGNKGMPLWQRLAKFMGIIWFSFIYIVEFLMRLTFVRDRNTAISGGDGVELWPRKIATASFRIDDMKAVKRAVFDATINDVLFGVISSGLSRYLDHRTPNALQDGQQITGLAMVNVRQQPGLQKVSELMRSNSRSRWGNKIGIILLPVQYYKSNNRYDPLQCVKRAKTMLDRKKQSLEGPFSHGLCHFVTSYLGSKIAGFLHYRLFCNTSFLISNIVGPQEEIAFGDNRITYIRENASSLPHAVTMHMLSYAGTAEMQISVAKDIIIDPEILAKCFEDALLEMKEAAAK